jgi:hypothetical protein
MDLPIIVEKVIFLNKQKKIEDDDYVHVALIFQKQNN